MNSPYGTEIIKRYFIALDQLIAQGVYKSDYEYTRTYGIDKSVFAKVRKDPFTRRPGVDWFAPLFIKHGLSTIWVYTGIGKPFPQ